MIVTKMTAVQGHNGMWRIAYDGVIMGDDRAFHTTELAEQEIRRRMKKDAHEAVIYNRPLLYNA